MFLGITGIPTLVNRIAVDLGQGSFGSHSFKEFVVHHLLFIEGKLVKSSFNVFVILMRILYLVATWERSLASVQLEGKLMSFLKFPHVESNILMKVLHMHPPPNIFLG